MDSQPVSWINPKGPPVLTTGQIHLWRASLDLPYKTIQRLEDLLSQEEIDHAQKFHYKKDQVHFVTAHGMLRTILGHYLQTPASEIRYAFNRYGKPHLKNNLPGHNVKFNLSHSGNLALIAVTLDREIGVDLEHILPKLCDLQIADRFFAPREVGVLQEMDPQERQVAFFKFWTCKEAYIKARGEGLSIALDAFEVSFTPGVSFVQLEVHENPIESWRWSLISISLGSEYMGALAVEDGDLKLSCFEWDPKLIVEDRPQEVIT
ncbi:MAG TPA: 4'-phosphopantetheinyl transferase superfamily protein [Anaerolineaceae bacterium]|nr:4'-phosphopantetheinyl transferase superfamily protein [Anaerolineaceae bacterium]